MASDATLRAVDHLQQRIGGDPDSFAAVDEIVRAYRHEMALARAEGRAQERAAIVTWLRERAHFGTVTRKRECLRAADAIEAGAHLPDEETP